ncbi:hypothetical protein R1sor_023762 [Riccia sorocarpa]|uniref:Rubisco LSMT substrate-binding domain-containing protein n=1 Tax=Riccia sorocarpa TaxID=122646 RepID=A0ABD3GQE2_9MARC
MEVLKQNTGNIVSMLGKSIKEDNSGSLVVVKLQVLLCYGLYNNLELLEHYGFLLPRNPNDNVHIGLPDAGEFGLDTINPPMQIPGAACVEISGHPSFSLLAALRLRACHSSLRRAKGHVALSGEQVSVESDILAYKWLEKKCKSLLESLPTKLEDDLVLQKRLIPVQSFTALEDLALSEEVTSEAKEVQEFLRACTSVGEGGAADEKYGVGDKDFQLERWKLALRWRIGYKEILHRCARLCSKKILHLGG